MNLKTLDKKDAVHVLNILSIILALGVTSYFFDAFATNNTVRLIGNWLMTPIYFADVLSTTLFNYSISGNFNLMFIILWLSYVAPFTALYPILMVKSHEVSELQEWYHTKGSTVS